MANGVAKVEGGTQASLLLVESDDLRLEGDGLVNHREDELPVEGYSARTQADTRTHVSEKR